MRHEYLQWIHTIILHCSYCSTNNCSINKSVYNEENEIFLHLEENTICMQVYPQCWEMVYDVITLIANFQTPEVLSHLTTIYWL